MTLLTESITDFQQALRAKYGELSLDEEAANPEVYYGLLAELRENSDLITKANKSLNT